MKTNSVRLGYVGIILFFIFPVMVGAAWYPSGTFINSTAQESNCSEDFQPDIVGPGIGDATGPAGDTGFMYAHGQTQVDGGGGCWWWDSTSPIATGISYMDGWTNQILIPLAWNASDYGGAGINNFDIHVYRSASRDTPSTLVDTLTVGGMGTTYIGQNGYAYRFEVMPRDGVGNIGSWVGSSNVVRIDTVDPNPSDLGDPFNTANPHLLATTSQNFGFHFDDGASPLKVWYRFENNNNPLAFDSLVTSDPYAYDYTYIRDISKVDNDLNIAKGSRELTILIDTICDQAGNCVNVPVPLKTFIYHSYANPNYNAINTTDTSDFPAAPTLPFIADGLPKTWKNKLTDGYGNVIITAADIDRKVIQSMEGVINTMFLNQFTRTGNSSVFVNTGGVIDTELGRIVSQSLGEQISSDGQYPLHIKTYTPTFDGYSLLAPVSDPTADFSFNLRFTIADALIGSPRVIDSSGPDFRYAPLYSSKLLGDLREGGFIEGTIQTSTISLLNNNISISPLGSKLELEFAGVNAGNFVLKGSSINANNPVLSSRNTMVDNPLPTLTSVTEYKIPLYTALLQNLNATIDNLSSIQLSTHFSYQLDGHDILYNGDVIGKEGGYHGINQIVGVQVGVKILGNIASNSIRELTTNQFTTNTSIFSEINRSTSHNSINKSIALATRNLKLTSVGDTILNSAILPSGSSSRGGIVTIGGDSSIMKLERNGGIVTLGNGSDLPISGKRTLVVRGANVYIKSNMYYANKNSILGIIVQKDENNRGGNLYIDPEITNLVGSYVIDGSIMSFDGVSEIGFSNIQKLKNQLYIYGSVTSENTIGGSRMNPVSCPTLLNIISIDCTLEKSQQYDLNYLRRYYLINASFIGGPNTINVPFSDGKIAGGAICDKNSGACSGFNPNLIKKTDNSNDGLAKYPLIIEYNPLIQTLQPIGFENQNK